ncbi:MAG: hypothetical protein KatS3mg004_0460 [Bryobacteraceae bacterium]|nr:MAG: hypothetical protein KatS3mg004_0460 [Bryobacteraceae bacterium]
MMQSNLRLALSLLVVFVSGVVVGAVGDRYLVKRQEAVQRPRSPEEFRRAYVAEMQKRLKLTPEQLEQLNRILDDTREQFRQLRERQRPEVRALQEQQTARINAILTPAQQEEYARMRREREEKRRQEEKQRGH